MSQVIYGVSAGVEYRHSEGEETAMLDIEIRSPQPFDLIGGAAVGRETVPVSLVSFGSSGGLRVKVRDSNGVELASAWLAAAGSGEFGGPYAIEIALPTTPTTKYGTVEFIEYEGAPPSHVILVVFGSVIMPGYFTYRQHRVVPGDSLWKIAEDQYKVGAEWTYIYEANSHQINDPDLIFPGQLLNIPHSTTTIFHR